MQNNLKDLKANVSVEDAWSVFALPGTPPPEGTSISSPFRHDNHPSFSIRMTEDGLQFSDFGIEQSGDLVSLTAIWNAWKNAGQKPMETEALLSVDLRSSDAVTQTLDLFGGWKRRRAQNRIPSPPKFTNGSKEPLNMDGFQRPDDLENFTDLINNRRIAPAVLKFLTSSGQLMEGQISGKLCWIITDEARKAAQARPIDAFTFYNGVKSKSLPGSDGGWPIGLAGNEGSGYFVICEGDTDYLAAHTINADLANSGVDASELPTPLCMTGATKKLGSEALSILAGKTVLIAADDDEAGAKAVENWTTQLHKIGAIVLHFPWPTLNMIYQSGTLSTVSDEPPPSDLSDILRSLSKAPHPVTHYAFVQTVWCKRYTMEKCAAVPTEDDDEFLDEYIDTEFPYDAYPDYAQELLNAVHKRVPGFPKEGVAVDMLAFTSASIGRGLVAVEEKTQFQHTPHEYFLLTASSGSGKSLTADILGEPIKMASKKEFEKWEQALPSLEAKKEGVAAEITNLSQLRAQHIKQGKSYSAVTEEIALKKEELHKIELKMHKPTFVVTSVTSERLGEILGRNGGYTFYHSTEAVSAIEALVGKYTGEQPDDSALLSCYTGDAIQDERISRKTEGVEKPYMTVCWLVTPDKVSKVYNNERLQSGGTLSRFLLCPLQTRSTPDRTGPLQDKSSLRGYNRYNATIQSAFENYRLSNEVKYVVVDADASDELDAFRREINERFENKSETLQIFAVRWLEHTGKLSIHLHVLKHGAEAHLHPITKLTVVGAIRLMRFFIGRFLVFTGIRPEHRQREELREKLINWCEAKMPSGAYVFRSRELRTGIFKSLNTEVIDSLLNTLVDDGVLIKFDPVGNQKKASYKLTSTE